HFGRSRKILHCQPREFGPGALADLALDGRYDYPQRDRLAGPLAQLGHRMRREELDLETERLQRVTGDVKAEDLLLARQTFRVAPLADVRQHWRGRALARLRGIVGSAKERTLARLAILLLERRVLQCAVE